MISGFIHLTNLDDDPHTDDGRVDIDLSASFYDQNWDYVTHISYTNLAESDLGAYHSGDIVNGGPLSGDGKAEFIDLDIETTAKQARYVVFQVYTFTELFRMFALAGCSVKNRNPVRSSSPKQWTVYLIFQRIPL